MKVDFALGVGAVRPLQRHPMRSHGQHEDRGSSEGRAVLDEDPTGAPNLEERVPRQAFGESHRDAFGLWIRETAQCFGSLEAVQRARLVPRGPPGDARVEQRSP